MVFSPEVAEWEHGVVVIFGCECGRDVCRDDQAPTVYGHLPEEP